MKFSNLFFKNNFFNKDNNALDLLELMKKSCLIHQDTSGIYSLLGLGLKLQSKIENVIKLNMQEIGFDEMQLSLLQDLKLWEKTGRVDSYGQELFKVKDRKNHSFCLGATAEELITQIVKDHYCGSKVSLNVFQIGHKFRDEMRARGGLVRSKQFIMKDGYSFYSDEEQLMNMYEEVKCSYKKIFNYFDLKYEIVASDNGEIGGKSSEEFVIESEFGEEKDGKKLLEIAHIFQLGQDYSQKMELIDNNKSAVHMGCYGIGVSRMLMALCEKNRDKYGFYGDENFSTFDLIISALDYHKSEKVKEFSDHLYKKYKSQGINVLLDDRQENAGKKLTDSELIGIKRRLIVSHQAIEKNYFEVLERKTMNKKFLSLNDLSNI